MGQTFYFKQKTSVTGANFCVTQLFSLKLSAVTDHFRIFTDFLQNSYCLEELLNAVTGQCFNARASNAELGSDETFLASLFIAFHM